MHLKATVVSIESASRFTDALPRITLRLDGCDPLNNEIRMPMTSGFCALNDRYVVEITRVEEEQAT
jgi:hypothetical protein